MPKEKHGGDIFAVARALGVHHSRLIDFSASINPLGMVPGAKAALVATLDDLLHYPDSSSHALKEALAAYHAVEVDTIAVANGSTELIHLMPKLIPGERALIAAPAFSEYAAALTRCGWDHDYFTADCDSPGSLSLPALAKALSRGYQLLFLCNPGNPTGSLLPLETVEKVLALCRESGTFLVLDEAFMDFCEEESAKRLFTGCESGVLLRSMTKFFAMPGLRLGYALGAQKTIAAIGARQDPWSVNTAAQIAGIASLADGAYRDRTRALVNEERALLAAGLSSLGWLTVFPSRVNYLLVRMEEKGSAAELAGALLRKGIIIRDCANFHGLDRRYFRVAVRSREENERLIGEIGAFGAKAPGVL